MHCPPRYESVFSDWLLFQFITWEIQALPNNKEIQKVNMIFNILHAATAFINLLSQQNRPAVNKILSTLQYRTNKADKLSEKRYHIEYVNISYLPTQGRKILNKEGKNTLLANLNGYLQNLLLIWFYFSITRKRMPQRKYVFLSIIESLIRAHANSWAICLLYQGVYCSVCSVHNNCNMRTAHQSDN